jgi:hypothetical protein
MQASTFTCISGNMKMAVHRFDAFTHTDQPERTRFAHIFFIDPFTVVTDTEDDFVREMFELNCDSACFCVPGNISERL